LSERFLHQDILLSLAFAFNALLVENLHLVTILDDFLVFSDEFILTLKYDIRLVGGDGEDQVRVVRCLLGDLPFFRSETTSTSTKVKLEELL
jgi:hypothetical protein